jgi:ABC-type transport system substrate-binding protein
VQQLGERYAQVQRDHQALLRAVWAAHAGVEVDTQGDSFFVAFARATDALAAASDAQRALAAHVWPAGARVRVRMGLHTGSAVLASPRQYIGLDVIRAARIAAAGHGGQVLLSQATRDQVAKELVAGAGLRDLGRHRLKGLARREEIYQLVLPGLPADYPPLKTLDAWPGYRADLSAVVFLSALLLATVGLLLPLLVPVFPQAIGLGAASLAMLILVISLLIRPVRRVLVSQWRDARKPFATVTSALLSVVVVVTTLFVTKPPTIIGPPPNPFTYTYHAPTHTGGTVTVGDWCSFQTLAPLGLGAGPHCYGSYVYLWQSCVAQLPDLSLKLLAGWKADQCADVPTVANGGESLDERTTTFRIDPRAVWSDGTPITADDFLFAHKLFADPTINNNGLPFYNLMQLTAPDLRTVQVRWSVPYADYLTALANMPPLPLKVYATSAFATVYDPRTDAYNSRLAQQLVQSAEFNTAIPVDNGPFTVESLPLTPANWAGAGPAVLARNPRFFSNFFHHPSALDRVTLVSALSDFPMNQPFPSKRRLLDDLIAQYRQGKLTLVQTLTPIEVPRLAGIPKGEVLTSPADVFIEWGFNQRDVAPNAQANDGHSMFADPRVRQAFVEAFDRCGAVRALLHVTNCTDPSLFSDELTTRPAPDYDPTFKLPAYNPTDAARLLDHAGYPVVDGVRRGKDGKTPLVLELILSYSALDSAELADRMQQDYARTLHVGVTVVTPGQDPFAPYDQGGDGATGAFDLLLFAGGGFDLDPVGSFQGNDAADIPSAQNPNGQNFFGIVDSHLGQTDQFGAQVYDGDQRALVYQALQRYFAQQLYYVPTYILADVALKQPTLCNYKPSLLNDSWNDADWYKAGSCP